MGGFKKFVRAACLATVCLAAYPVSIMSPAVAETAATPDESKMSDADKLAKAQDCSKQADAKKLHGEARKKFRANCKRGK